MYKYKILLDTSSIWVIYKFYVGFQIWKLDFFLHGGVIFLSNRLVFFGFRTRTHTRTRTRTRIRTHTHPHTHAPAYVHAHTRTRVHTCIHAITFACLWIENIHIKKWIHIVWIENIYIKNFARCFHNEINTRLNYFVGYLVHHLLAITYWLSTTYIYWWINFELIC